MKYVWLSLTLLTLFSCTDEKESDKSDSSDTVEKTEKLVVKDTNVVLDETAEHELNFALLSAETNDKELDSLIYVTSSFYAVTNSDIDEIRSEWKDMQSGLTNLRYQINYNKNGIFDITYDIEYLGAHFSYDYYNVNLDLHAKTPIDLLSILDKDKLPEFLGACNEKLNENLKFGFEDIPEEDKEEMKEYFEGHEVTEESLSEFSVHEDGIVIHFNTFFPYYARVYEPNSMLFFSYSEISNFLDIEQDLSKRLLKDAPLAS